MLSLLVVQEIRFAQRSIQRVFFFLFAKLQGGGVGGKRIFCIPPETGPNLRALSSFCIHLHIFLIFTSDPGSDFRRSPGKDDGVGGAGGGGKIPFSLTRPRSVRACARVSEFSRSRAFCVALAWSREPTR